MNSRLLPDTAHPDFAAFWSGCAAGTLLMPRCANGHIIWPPRPACPTCLEPTDHWAEVARTGRLYSWTVIHRTRLRWYAERTPYVVGVISLDHPQLVRMVGRCDVDPGLLAEGLRLRVDFESAAGLAVPYWRPDGPHPAGTRG